MLVGWLADDPGYLGGAELTMAEFKAAAPDHVEVVDCAPGKVTPGMDRYVVGNCSTYSHKDLPAFGYTAPVVRYHHDVQPRPLDSSFTVRRVRHAFASPLQRRRMHMDGELIPPAIDLEQFRHPTDELWGKKVWVTTNGKREGACCIGRMAYGKGVELLAEYEEPVDVYSTVPFRSQGNARYAGAAENVAQVLGGYERFIFLPTALEPFGRAVVEAWASGLDVIVNRNVGCRYWIEEAPEKLESAAEDFWGLVCG